MIKWRGSTEIPTLRTMLNIFDVKSGMLASVVRRTLSGQRASGNIPVSSIDAGLLIASNDRFICFATLGAQPVGV